MGYQDDWKQIWVKFDLDFSRYAEFIPFQDKMVAIFTYPHSLYRWYADVNEEGTQGGVMKREYFTHRVIFSYAEYGGVIFIQSARGVGGWEPRLFEKFTDDKFI